ncbi:MAG: hypothetical protein WBM32_22660 [Crocosphaera sp.]
MANLAGITFTACLIFLSQSYGNLNKSFQSMVIWLLIMGILFGPLSNSLQEFLVSNRLSLEMNQMRIAYPQIWQDTQIRYVGVDLKGSTAYVTILLNAPEGLLTDEHLESAKERLFGTVSGMGVNAMDLNFRIIPVRVREYQSIIAVLILVRYRGYRFEAGGFFAGGRSWVYLMSPRNAILNDDEI